MTDQQSTPQTSAKAPKERSPSFPFISLPSALARLAALEEKFGRHPTPANKIGLAWGMKEASSQAAQTVAALKSFGMVQYEGGGPGRFTIITEDGRNFLRAQQESVKLAIVRRLALTPKVIASYWQDWGRKRPIDEVALDELVLKAAFTQSAAETFLRVYDETIAYAGLTDSDKDADADGDAAGAETPPAPELAVGDWVSVEAGGQVVFDKTRIREISGDWVFVEASQTGSKMSDVTLLEKGAQIDRQPPTLPFAPKVDERGSAGDELDRFTVDEGVVKITFPTGMSADSVSELEQFFQLFIKKAKRRAGAEKPD